MNNPILVVSRSFPPSVVAGTSTVAYRLFKNINPLDYVVIRGDLHPNDATTKLNCTDHIFEIFPRRYVYTRFSFLFVPGLIISTILFLKRNKIKPRQVLAFYPFSFYAIAAYYVARFLKIPFSVYFMDVWEEAEGNWFGRKLAHHFEPILVKSADPLITLSEPLQTHFVKKYGLTSHTILHPLPIDQFHPEVRYQKIEKKKFKIVYTGNIYELNRVAVENMIKAVRLLPQNTFEIFFFGGQSFDDLTRFLDLDPNDPVQVEYINSSDVPLIQRNADILFAGISASGLNKITAETTFPTKFVEYLAAGQPILIQAPVHTYFAQFCLKNQCAEVVTESSPEAVKLGLEKIINDHEYAFHLAQQAVKTVQMFNADTQVYKLAKLFGLRTQS